MTATNKGLKKISCKIIFLKLLYKYIITLSKTNTCLLTTSNAIETVKDSIINCTKSNVCEKN